MNSIVLKTKHKLLIHKLRIYGFEKLSSFWDFLLFFLRIPTAPKTKYDDAILFVGEFLLPRIPRMAKWIKRESQFPLVLLCHKRGFVEKFSDPCFDAVYLFRNEWHLKRIMSQIHGVKLVHGFAPKSYFPNVARKYFNRPYIQDMQDVYSIYYPDGTDLNWLKKELPHELECITKANGIVAHSLEPNVALRLLKSKQKPNSIFFPLYCDDDFFESNTKSLNSDNIHLVYAGGVAGSHRNPAQYGNTQFHQFIEILTKQQLHFHMYPSPLTIRADYEEYEKIAEENPYFHFHAAVSQNDLGKELSQYHFGILPFFKNQSQQSDLKLKYATTLKLFNYLEAGLPVLVSEDIIYQHWILNRYGCSLTLNFDSIDKIRDQIEGLNYTEMVKKVTAVRSNLSLKKHTKRLIEFYSKF